MLEKKLRDLNQSLENGGNLQQIAKALYDMYNNDEITELSIVSADLVCDSIRIAAEKNNLMSIANLVNDITDFSQQFYYEDGYSNYSDLTKDNLECILYDLIKEMEE